MNLTIDAQIACSSFGLTSGSAMHDRCVNHEVDVRRYREAVVTTPVPITYPAHGTTTYVTTTSPAPPTVHVPAIQTPPAGPQAFRDEFGFRYDGRGNRIDRNGNIISPQSTSP
jgi:hypothetical protein